jgi:PAS domain S-box-containing protein
VSLPLIADHLSSPQGGVDPWWIVIGSLITAVSTAVVAVMAAWYQQGKQKRADALAEWQAIVERQQADLDHLVIEVKQLRVDHDTTRQRLSDCEVSRAELRTELKIQLAAIRRLQERTGDAPPASVMPGLLIADAGGIIQAASPALTPILHYLPAELRGKSVEILIPERHRLKHRQGLAKLLSSNTSPWSDRVILTEALTKEGDEVQVAITLSGWQTTKGDWQLSAEVKLRRLDGEQGGSGSSSGILIKGTGS